MAAEENRLRKTFAKAKGGVEPMIKSARLRIMSKYLGIEIKRFRDPGKVDEVRKANGKIVKEDPNKEETVFLFQESG